MLKPYLPLILSAAFLTACNSETGTSDDESSGSDTTVSGTVADGYLVGAKVCLDFNVNMACDDGEPSTMTTEGGAYLLDASYEDLEQYNIIVEVTTSTIDEDTGETVGKPYVLTTPIGQDEFISPITTLLQSKLAGNPALDLETAEEQLADELGLEDDDDLYEDFIMDSSLDDLHKIAQVAASAFGDALEALEGATTEDDVTQELMMIAADVVRDNLPSLVAAVSETADDDFDPSTLASNIAGDSISEAADTVDSLITEKQQVLEAESVTPRSVFEDGMYGFYIDFDLDDSLLYGELETNSLYLNSEDELESEDCEQSWNVSLLSFDDATCEIESSTEIEDYTDSEDAYYYPILVNGQLTLIDVKTITESASFADDDTYVFTVEVLGQDDNIYITTDELDLGVSVISLAGTSIAEMIENALVQNKGFGGTEYGLLASDDVYQLVISSDFHNYFDSNATFSSDAAYYLYTLIETDSEPYFEKYISFYEIVDGGLNWVDKDDISFDEWISGNYYLNIYNYNSDSSVFIQLNGSVNATSGTATLHPIVEDDYNVDTETVLVEIPWTIETRYGHEALVFDTSELQTYNDLTAVYNIDGGTWITEESRSTSNNRFVYFNQDAAADIETETIKAVEAWADENVNTPN